MSAWLTRDQVAEILGIKPDTLSGMVTRGQVPQPDEHVGRTPRWSLATIDAYLTERAEKLRQRAVKLEALRRLEEGR
jgi:predicted DNA-binding transcriptional regulator AlpA